MVTLKSTFNEQQNIDIEILEWSGGSIQNTILDIPSTKLKDIFFVLLIIIMVCDIFRFF